jgi:methyl-accepting chemotaxis protein
MPTQPYVHFSDRMTDSLMNINKVINDNKSTLDSIQDMAVELTRAIRSLQTVVNKYVNMADNILDTIVPIMEGLPIVPDTIKEFAKDALALSKKIIATSELAEKVLPGVEAGLTTADMSKLQASTGQVTSLTKALQAMIPAGAK